MYFTDRGIEELEDRRADDRVTLGWLAERLREFVDLSPESEPTVERLATWLARLDDDPDEAGYDAVTGLTDATGVAGLDGVADATGLDGVADATGLDGVAGVDGVTDADRYEDGADGVTGVAGVTDADRYDDADAGR